MSEHPFLPPLATWPLLKQLCVAHSLGHNQCCTARHKPLFTDSLGRPRNHIRGVLERDDVFRRYARFILMYYHLQFRAVDERNWPAPIDAELLVLEWSYFRIELGNDVVVVTPIRSQFVFVSMYHALPAVRNGRRGRPHE